VDKLWEQDIWEQADVSEADFRKLVLMSLKKMALKQDEMDKRTQRMLLEVHSFRLVKNMVYGFTTLALVTMFGALFALVIRK
jgi:hypothetical protein